MAPAAYFWRQHGPTHPVAPADAHPQRHQAPGAAAHLTVPLGNHGRALCGVWGCVLRGSESCGACCVLPYAFCVHVCCVLWVVGACVKRRHTSRIQGIPNQLHCTHMLPPPSRPNKHTAGAPTAQTNIHTQTHTQTCSHQLRRDVAAALQPRGAAVGAPDVRKVHTDDCVC